MAAAAAAAGFWASWGGASRFLLDRAGTAVGVEELDRVRIDRLGSSGFVVVPGGLAAECRSRLAGVRLVDDHNVASAQAVGVELILHESNRGYRR